MWQMWAGGAGAPFAPVVALAVEEGPPIPAARLGPIHVMGRAVHSRVHTLSGHMKRRRRPVAAEVAGAGGTRRVSEAEAAARGATAAARGATAAAETRAAEQVAAARRAAERVSGERVARVEAAAAERAAAVDRGGGGG